MRVITGTARGRKLSAVPGEDTRPTSANVKEAVFNIIQFDIQGRRVLDLFAGTGQMGIETLSRGAAHAVFVDSRAEAAKTVRENVKLTGFQDQSTVLPADALGVLLPVATNPLKLKSMNDWAKGHASPRIIPFGAAHPLAPDALEHLHYA